MRKNVITKIFGFFIILTMFLLNINSNFINVYADEQHKPGDIIGHVYSTDIVAYIDDMAIPSYNIGGKTVVSENDLVNYGFNVTWNPTYRDLTIEIDKKPDKAPKVNIKKNKPGKILGNVYYTDIIVSFNGFSVDAYNIGGKTLISLEDLAKEFECDRVPQNDNSKIGYSNCGVKTIWDPNTRSIKAKFIRPGNTIETEYGNFKIIDTRCDYHQSYYNNKDCSTCAVQIDLNKSSTPFVNAYVPTDILSLQDINYHFNEGKLIVNYNKDINLTHDSSTIRNISFGIIPLIEFPIEIIENDKTINNDNIHGMIFRGKIYVKVDELAKILNTECKEVLLFQDYINK